MVAGVTLYDLSVNFIVSRNIVASEVFASGFATMATLLYNNNSKCAVSVYDTKLTSCYINDVTAYQSTV